MQVALVYLHSSLIWAKIHSSNVRCSLKLHKIHLTPIFKYFGISGLFKVIDVGTLESSSAVFVMISRSLCLKSLSICNRFSC